MYSPSYKIKVEAYNADVSVANQTVTSTISYSRIQKLSEN